MQTVYNGLIMKRKHLLMLLFLTITYNICTAQNNEIKPPQRGISISYWGPLIGSWWSPEDVPWGARLGYETYFLNTPKFNVVGRSSIVFQQMTDKYTAGGITLSSVLQRTFKFGLYLEQSFMIGYLGSHYNFDVYKVNSDDQVVNVGHKLFNSALYGFGIGVGYDFSKVTDINLKVFFNPVLYNKVPNNDNPFLLYNYSFDFGVVFYPKWIQKKEK